MSLSRAVIVHGYSATPADHWFDDLARTLTAAGVETSIPALPDPAAPDVRRWTDAVAAAVGAPDARTAVIAHSLGAVTVLHALERLPGEWQLGAMVAVAGFVDPLPVLPQLDAFTAAPPDVARVAAHIVSRTVVLSDDDAYVPAGHALALGEALSAEVVVVPGAGHFLAEEGITSLPDVERILLDR